MLIKGFPTVLRHQIGIILREADTILTRVTIDDGHQHGGILCVAEPETGRALFLGPFGVLTAEEYDEYTIFAQEKARRLATNRAHFTSWQSRDMTTNPKRYAGAVKLRDGHILSFSGFKEEQDEAAMLVLAMNIGAMDGGPAALLAQLSGNQYFRKLQNFCGGDSTEPSKLYQLTTCR